MTGLRDAGAPLTVGALMVLGFGGVKLYRWHESGEPLWVVIGVALALVIVLCVVAAALYKTLSKGPKVHKLTDTSRMTDMFGQEAAEKGASLRRSFTDADKAQLKPNSFEQMREVAGAIGRINGKIIWRSIEDFTLVFMGPRSNKTSAVAVPRVLEAPGPVVATSNKPDLWMLTSGLRANVGPVYTFDLSHIVFASQSCWWNILGHVSKLEDAEILVDHFIATVAGTADRSQADFFSEAGKELLTQLFLAAAVSGRTVRDVVDWLSLYDDEPVELLKAHGHTRTAEAIQATLELPWETKGGIYKTASTAVKCLRSEDTLRWITPPATWTCPPEAAPDEIDLWTFVSPTSDGTFPTLYLLTQEGAGTAAPVVAAMVDRLFRIALLSAAAQGGRCDPSPTVVLDEAANICRIADLPDLASYLGGIGVLVDVILQSRKQGIRVWGQTGMDALWSASTVRIAGAGLQDIEFARDLSALVGDRKIKETTRSWSPGGSTDSEHWVREPILEPADVAAIDREHALLIRPGSRPVMMDLMPWYREEHADTIGSRKSLAEAQVQDAAIEYLGADNPVAVALLRARQASQEHETSGGAEARS